MIKLIKGNLLDADEDAIGHGCNTKRTMGSGVAKAIRAKWPVVYQADLDFDKAAGKNKIGMFSNVVVGKKTIYNIYTQVEYLPRNIDHFEYDGFELGLTGVMLDMKSRGLASLALPKIGSGLAGGNWSKIRKIIERVSDMHNIPVTIYEI